MTLNLTSWSGSIKQTKPICISIACIVRPIHTALVILVPMSPSLQAPLFAKATIIGNDLISINNRKYTLIVVLLKSSRLRFFSANSTSNIFQVLLIKSSRLCGIGRLKVSAGTSLEMSFRSCLCSEISAFNFYK